MAVCASCATDNPPQAKYCLECGVVLAPLSTAADRRPVTALFCDLVGSTQLGERLDAEALRLVMREYYETMRGVLEAHGGTVEKFIGDAVVAIFGVPAVHEDDALRAARAALEMQGAVPGLNERLVGYGATLQIRVGIQSGEVIAGEEAALVGGDTFNTAARLQSVAAPGETIVGDTSADLLRDMAQLEPIPPQSLAGKAGPVKAFRLTSVDLRRPVRTSTRLIGRDRVLSALVRTFEDAVADGACVLATVLGLSGVGKTRLAEELVRRLGSRALVLSGQTPAYGEGRAYAPVIDLLYGISGIADRDPEAAAAVLRERLHAMSDGDAVAERLADLLGVGSGAAAGETSWALRRLLERLAEERPLVVVLDDVHWADAALLELIDNVVERVRGPILLLCLARPELLEVRPGWAGGKPRAVTMTLEALEDDAAHELARLLLGQAADEEIARRVARSAEGNPLYVEQYVAMLADGVRPEQWSVPPGIQTLLAARLDQLERADADLLSTAAVEGHEFSVSTIAMLLDGRDATTMLGALDRLERRALVRRVDDRAERWTFAHSLLRDAAERRLPKQVRADFHARLAGVALSSDDEIIGFHYERAAALRAELGMQDAETERLRRLAGGHLAAAGNRAFARLDLLATANLLGRAAELLPSGFAERVALLPDLAVALAETGRPEEAIRLLEDALVETAAPGHEVERLRATVQLLSTRIYLDPTSEALEQATVDARATVASLAALDDSIGLAQAWVLVEYLGWMQGVVDVEACVNAIEHAHAAGRLREELQAAGDLPGYLQGSSATPADIDAIADRLAESADRVVQASTLVLRAVAAGLRGDRATLSDLDAAASELLLARGLEFLHATHAETVATALIDLGQASEGERRIREASATMHAIGDVWWEFELETVRVTALLAQGDVQGAGALVDALSAWEAPRSRFTEAVWARARSRVLLERGRTEEALDTARHAVELVARSDLVTLHGDALENLAVIESSLGHHDEARTALEEALAIYERKGSVPRAERLNTLLRTSA